MLQAKEVANLPVGTLQKPWCAKKICPLKISHILYVSNTVLTLQLYLHLQLCSSRPTEGAL